MVLTKNFNVLRSLVTECMKRRSVFNPGDKQDIQLGLHLLRFAFRDSKELVPVICASHRFVGNFNEALGAEYNCVFIQDVDQIIGERLKHVIVLHTGTHSKERREAFKELIIYLNRAHQGTLCLWNVSEWR